MGGSIPATLGGLSGLTWLDVGYNELTGAIPAAVGPVDVNLVGLFLGGNAIDGPIPAELAAACTNLRWLWLSGKSVERGHSGGVGPAQSTSSIDGSLVSNRTVERRHPGGAGPAFGSLDDPERSAGNQLQRLRSRRHLGQLTSVDRRCDLWHGNRVERIRIPIALNRTRRSSKRIGPLARNRLQWRNPARARPIRVNEEEARKAGNVADAQRGRCSAWSFHASGPTCESLDLSAKTSLSGEIPPELNQLISLL